MSAVETVERVCPLVPNEVGAAALVEVPVAFKVVRTNGFYVQSGMTGEKYPAICAIPHSVAAPKYVIAPAPFKITLPTWKSRAAGQQEIQVFCTIGFCFHKK